MHVPKRVKPITIIFASRIICINLLRYEMFVHNVPIYPPWNREFCRRIIDYAILKSDNMSIIQLMSYQGDYAPALRRFRRGDLRMTLRKGCCTIESLAIFNRRGVLRKPWRYLLDHRRD